MTEQMETSEQLATLSMHVGFGAAMAAKLMIGFWFGIGVILAIRVVDGGLNCCIGVLTSNSSK